MTTTTYYAALDSQSRHHTSWTPLNATSERAAKLEAGRVYRHGSYADDIITVGVHVGCGEVASIASRNAHGGAWRASR
jgi:hypothetical protein